MIRIILFAIIAFGIISPAFGQDQNERFYMYPVPSNIPGAHAQHEEKPKVRGWAQERVEEKLNRGVIAIPDAKGQVYVGWRMLQTDPPETSFNVYRSTDGSTPVKLNNEPLIITTDFIDKEPALGHKSAYWIRPVVGGNELAASGKVLIEADAKNDQIYYKSIEFQGNYMPDKIGVADLNGDGAYDFIIKQPNYSIDPGGSPNTDGTTYKLEAYLNDGTFLWRKDLGLGIEPGIWYSPYLVYDFNGDGKAEVAVKTAPGAERESNGRVLSGKEWVSILDGMTGEELSRAPWPERGVRFGDYNRNNRNQMGVAYLDGKTPCLLVARGTYKRMVLDAYQFHNGELEQLWRWDGDEENPIIRGQGAHSMRTADVDGDGRDEVILGSVVIDDNGTALWSTGYGHPDNVFVSDIDPTRPGMEVFYAVENWHFDGNGVVLVDAKTGETIWNIGHNTYHIGEGMAADIDPSIPGLEVFAAEDPKGNGNGASSDRYMLSASGEYLARNAGVPPTIEDWLFWDDDLLREMILPEKGSTPDRSNTVSKYNGPTITTGIEGQKLITADVLGDWREEVITILPGELRIYTTTISAKDRRESLMQDPIYRTDVAHLSMGYDQSPMTSYYLGVAPDDANEYEPVIQSQ